jgi:hypothetical protein
MTNISEQRHARDMTPEQYKAKLAELKRDPPPEPMPPLDKEASQQVRDNWLREYRRRQR